MAVPVSADVSLGALEALLNEFFAPVTTNARKQVIEGLLEQFVCQPAASGAFLSYLTSSANPYVCMFSLTSLEVRTVLITNFIINREVYNGDIFFSCVQRIVNQQWMGMNAEQRLEIRAGLQAMLEQHHANCPPFIRNKLVKLLVDVARVSWPHEYATFFDEIFQVIVIC